MAGLPGTGLGGVFYILLILWMILRKSAKPDIYAKWRRLIPLGSMAIAIVMVLWGEMWIIGKTVGRLPTFADIVSSGIPTSGVLAIALAFVPLLTLAALLMALHLARLLIPRDRVRSQAVRSTRS
jgi:peptidoglycan biosynthesis protein MviN/MurJ (putative lipid II flippase)